MDSKGSLFQSSFLTMCICYPDVRSPRAVECAGYFSWLVGVQGP